MPSIRIRKEPHQRLSQLSEETGKSQTTLVEEAIGLLEEEIFYRRMRATYGELEAAETARRELEAWDQTLSDGSEITD
ncbi:MAG: ribbon-helix-helix domain-containing protein [Bradymonadaceae bacterium]